MKDLKTLKDLELMSNTYYRIKQEAVKWVKKYQKQQKKYYYDSKLVHYYAGKIAATIEQNNITEEDLIN